jgi:hypothetical protein
MSLDSFSDMSMPQIKKSEIIFRPGTGDLNGQRRRAPCALVVLDKTGKLATSSQIPLGAQNYFAKITNYLVA